MTAKVPAAPAALAEQVTGFVQELRRADLYKVTGVSETLDWVAALVALDKQELDAATIERTLGMVLKTQEDMQSMRQRADSGHAQPRQGARRAGRRPGCRRAWMTPRAIRAGLQAAPDGASNRLTLRRTAETV